MKHLQAVAVSVLSVLAAGHAAATPIVVDPAEPAVSERPDFLDVEYWTTSGVGEEGQRYGKLRIDLSLAPPDNRPDDEFLGNYTWLHQPRCSCLEDVSGFVQDLRFSSFEGRSIDNVEVIDHRTDIPYPFDYFSVSNGEWLRNADGTQDSTNLHLSLSALRGFDFIDGDSLNQRFDVRTDGVNVTGEGSFNEAFGDVVGRLFHFTIARLRVTPRICRS